MTCTQKRQPQLVLFTSLPVSFRYTAPKVSSLYSVVLRSLGSRYTCKQF